MPTFGEWLRSQRGREDAIGKLAERIVRDRSLTDDDYDAIRRHLVAGNTDGTAIDALDDAHAEYERSDDPPKPPPEPLSTEF
jgi:uncharacterized protein YozE (UPF0346 family)